MALNCEVPWVLDSDKAAERYYCEDVEWLTDKELLAELWRMQFCIAQNEAEEWFWERLEAVREEIEIRRRENGKRT